MPSDLADLPPALSSEQAAALLGCARGTLWAAARDDGGITDAGGTVVVRPFHLGRALRWPREQLLSLLRPVDAAGGGLAPVIPLGAQGQLPESSSSGGAAADGSA
jgi:hypothetical protein